MNLTKWTLLFFLFSCSSSQIKPRDPASLVNPPLISGEVWTAEDDQVAQQILQETKNIALKNAVDGKVRRDAHPKHHACVKAYWSAIKTSLESDAQVGIFQSSNHNRMAWIRFSNGDPKGNKIPDSANDIRGLAIKIMNEPNTPRGSQDLIAITSPTFFSRDSQDYLNLFHAIQGGTASLLSYAAQNPRNAYKLYQARVAPENPLLLEYFTSVPARIGAGIQRLRFSPCPETTRNGIKFKDVKDQKNGMRTALTKTLEQSNACIRVDMHINPQPTSQEIEDSTLQWDSRTTEWKFVGELLIPKQNLQHTAQDETFCENISMDPWNTIPDIRPVGRISRIRKIVYDEISKFRLREQGLSREEPTDFKP